MSIADTSHRNSLTVTSHFPVLLSSPVLLQRGNEEFMKAGVRGLSILFASGDYGTGCNASSLPAKFAPEWPPSSPYVTAVGGTTGGTTGAPASSSSSSSSSSSLSSARTVTTGSKEVAWGKGGGGFAFTAPRPSYQVRVHDVQCSDIFSVALAQI